MKSRLKKAKKGKTMKTSDNEHFTSRPYLFITGEDTHCLTWNNRKYMLSSMPERTRRLIRTPLNTDTYYPTL